MRKFNLFTVLIISAYLVTVECSGLPEGRIVGGYFASPNQFPHQAILKRMSIFHCGGSIISKNYILTAAHCATNSFGAAYSPEVLEVAVGTNDLNGGTTYKVSQVIVHEKYGNFQNDIALLKLSSPIKFSNSVKVVELFTGTIRTGSEIIISGFGRVYHGGPVSQKLKFNTAKAMSTIQCAQNSGISFDGLLCLAHPTQNGACNGDSGGPALLNGKLVGVANFVLSSCGSAYPDGYAKVPYYINWIKLKADL